MKWVDIVFWSHNYWLIRSLIFSKEYWATLWRYNICFLLFLFLINFSLTLPSYRNEFLLWNRINAISSLGNTAGNSILLNVKLLELLLNRLPFGLVELGYISLDVFFLEVWINLWQLRCYQFFLCFHGLWKLTLFLISYFELDAFKALVEFSLWLSCSRLMCCKLLKRHSCIDLLSLLLGLDEVAVFTPDMM